MKRRETFISPTRGEAATITEAIERDSHIAAAEQAWRDGRQVIAYERLAEEILRDNSKPVRGRYK